MTSVVMQAYFVGERDSKLQQNRSCLLYVRKLQGGPSLRKVLGIFAHTRTRKHKHAMATICGTHIQLVALLFRQTQATHGFAPVYILTKSRLGQMSVQGAV